MSLRCVGGLLRVIFCAMLACSVHHQARAVDADAVEIEVSGADDPLRSNTQAHLVSLELKMSASGPRRERRIDMAIRKAAAAVGYYDIDYVLSWQPQLLNVEVEPGPVVRWVKPQLRVADDAILDVAVLGEQAAEV